MSFTYVEISESSQSYIESFGLNILQNGTGGGYFKKSDIPDKHVGFTGLGLGHMADPVVAAFDPIFWLHHW